MILQLSTILSATSQLAHTETRQLIQQREKAVLEWQLQIGGKLVVQINIQSTKHNGGQVVDNMYWLQLLGCLKTSGKILNRTKGEPSEMCEHLISTSTTRYGTESYLSQMTCLLRCLYQLLMQSNSSIPAVSQLLSLLRQLPVAELSSCCPLKGSLFRALHRQMLVSVICITQKKEDLASRYVWSPQWVHLKRTWKPRETCAIPAAK